MSSPYLTRRIREWREGGKRPPAPTPAFRHRGFPPRRFSQAAECLGLLLWFAAFIVVVVVASVLLELTMDVLFGGTP